MSTYYKKYIEFKHEEDKVLFTLLHPFLIAVIADMAIYCSDRGLPFVVTDTVSTPAEDKKLSRVSKSHSTCRAIDVSSRHWSLDDISKFKEYYDDRYAEYAAISKSNGKPNLVVHHNAGKGWHMHIQIHHRYSLQIDN